MHGTLKEKSISLSSLKREWNLSDHRLECIENWDVFPFLKVTVNKLAELHSECAFESCLFSEYEAKLVNNDRRD